MTYYDLITKAAKTNNINTLAAAARFIFDDAPRAACFDGFNALGVILYKAALDRKSGKLPAGVADMIAAGINAAF